MNLERIGTPNKLFLETIPTADRMSREDLIKTANMYFSGMEKNDGKGVYPFTDDCNRIENGSLTTNVPPRGGQPRPDPKTSASYSSAWGCKEQFESGLIHFVWAHSRPALCRRRPGMRGHRPPIRLLRSCPRERSHVPDSVRPERDGRSD